LALDEQTNLPLLTPAESAVSQIPPHGDVKSHKKKKDKVNIKEVCKFYLKN